MVWEERSHMWLGLFTLNLPDPSQHRPQHTGSTGGSVTANCSSYHIPVSNTMLAPHQLTCSTDYKYIAFNTDMSHVGLQLISIFVSTFDKLIVDLLKGSTRLPQKWGGINQYRKRSGNFFELLSDLMYPSVFISCSDFPFWFSCFTQLPLFRTKEVEFIGAISC